VGKNLTLPPIEKDPNLPVVAAAGAGAQATLDRSTIQRTFLRDCGPAAIAVGLPGGQTYCFDATQCRLRYAWRGGFVDHSPQWLGKGDHFATVIGHVYYRAPDTARLRAADRKSTPQVKWLGYRMEKSGPELRYMLDGATVIERPRVASSGAGLDLAYEISGASGAVTFEREPDGGATVTCDRGKWAGNRLTLTAEEARRFTLTLKERPGIEPLAYFSMNDAYFSARSDPLPGVIGRAFTPGGTGGKREVLDSGIAWAGLQHGGTLMSWVKRQPASPAKEKDAADGPIFSAGKDAKSFRLHAPTTDTNWHHVAAVVQHGRLTLYVDGRPHGTPQPVDAVTSGNIEIGSAGPNLFFNGLLDEVRIYDRVLTADEIAAIHRREHAAAKSGPAS
jgi:hypothetical protein